MPAASAIPLTATTITPTVPVAASHEAAAPTTAADGRVKLQASTIRPAIPSAHPPAGGPPPLPPWIAGAHLGGGQRQPEVGGGEDHCGAGRLGAETLGRVDVADASAEGPDDPPATRVGAEPDRRPGGQDDPGGRWGARREDARGDQGQRD